MRCLYQGHFPHIAVVANMDVVVISNRQDPSTINKYIQAQTRYESIICYTSNQLVWPWRVWQRCSCLVASKLAGDACLI